MTKMKRLMSKEMPDGSRTLFCKNGGNSTLAGLRQLREDKTLCDIIIKVKDEEILAHKNILVINSPYFHAMFLEDFSEAQAREVKLQEDSIDASSARILVDFMYTGQLSVTGDNVQNLVMAADLWQMPEVKQLSEHYMECHIDVHNCLGIWRFAELYSCEWLARKSEHLLKQRFPLVAQGAEFVQLTASMLEHILSLPDLSLGHEGEDVVVKALFRWVDHQPGLTTEELYPLLRTVNWSATSFACRRHFLHEHPALTQSTDLQQLIQNLTETKTDGGRQAQTTLYVMGGFLQSRTGLKCPRLKSVEKLDTVLFRWMSCDDLPLLSSAGVAFNLHGHLFYCACEPVSSPNSSATITRTEILEYNMISDEWISAESQFSVQAVDRLDSCLQAEGSFALCPQTNTIYTVSHSEVAFITVTVIDGNVSCHTVGLLPRPHAYFTERQRHHAAVMLGDHLYVMGGDRQDAGSDPVPTARVIRFDCVLKTWHPCADMLEPRAKLAVAVLKGKIYANGGFNTQRLATMECYDPATDQWTALKAMTRYRSHHQLLVLHNSLWAIGGKSYAVGNGGARKVINLCEVYDPDSDTWTEDEVHKMQYARCSFAAVAI